MLGFDFKEEMKIMEHGGNQGFDCAVVTWADTSAAASTTRSYRLSLFHSRDELGVPCQTNHLVDGGASLEAAWAKERRAHTQSVRVIKNSSTVTSVC